jgi:hypothetical protein
MDRFAIVLYFLGGVLLLCGIAPLFAILGGLNDRDDDDDEVPADPLPADHRPRSVDALHTGARVAAVRGVRFRNERVEHLADKLERRKAEHWQLGAPAEPAPRVNVFHAADRLRAAAQTCTPTDAA